MVAGPDRELLERDSELATLQAVVASIGRGDGALAVVEGQPGIGKTSLLDVVRFRARATGFRVCSARAGELDRDFPYGVVSQLLEPAVMSISAEERDGLFSGPAAPAAQVLLGADVDASAPDASFAILRAMYRVVAGLAETCAVVMVVDDLHWCDRPSLRFLTYLAKRLEDLAVCIVVALRPADPEARGELLDELRLDPHATLVAPKPLSSEAVQTAVRAATSAGASEEFCGACHRATAGNPLYLRELLRVVGDGALEPSDATVQQVAAMGPETISRLVMRRLSRVGPSAPVLARAMAVLGDGGSLRIAALLAGVDQKSVGKLARSLCVAEILSSQDPVTFVHPVVRRAIYADMPAHETEEAHLAAAMLLDREDAPIEQAAAHLLTVKPASRDWCVDVLQRAAQEALARGAPDVGVTYLRRALAERPSGVRRLAVLRELARAEEHAGDPLALDHMGEAFEAAKDPRERGETAIELARTFEAFSRGWEALDTLWSVRDEVDPSETDLIQRIELAALSAGILGGRRLDDRIMQVLLRYMQNVPEGPGAQVALAAGAVASATAGAYEQAIEMTRQALEQVDLPNANWDAAGTAIWTTLSAERFDYARAFLEPALMRMRELGHARGLNTIQHTLGLLHYCLGELAEAESYARQALEITKRSAAGLGVVWPMAILLDTWVDQGDLDAAERALEPMSAGDWPPHLSFMYLLASRGRLRCAQGKYQRGLDDLLEVRRRGSAEVLGIDLPSAATSRWRSSAALALLQLGELDRARELADAELAEAEAIHAAATLPRALGIARRVAGLCRGDEEGVELLRQSVATLEESPAVLERARSLVELGAALRRANSRAAARDPLRRGLELALRCGAAPLVAQAREELAASGAKPRRDAVTGRDALTPSEQRVAQLAADEMTNREIAQALYLSVRTVEMHLAHVYRKVGIASRRELAGALAQAA